MAQSNEARSVWTPEDEARYRELGERRDRIRGERMGALEDKLEKMNEEMASTSGDSTRMGHVALWAEAMAADAEELVKLLRPFISET